MCEYKTNLSQTVKGLNNMYTFGIIYYCFMETSQKLLEFDNFDKFSQVCCTALSKNYGTFYSAKNKLMTDKTVWHKTKSMSV